MTKRELQAELAAVRAEAAELRRERDGILAALANAHIEPEMRILAVALAFWHHEQVPGTDGFVRLDAEEVARRAGTTPEAVQEQAALWVDWGRLVVQQRREHVHAAPAAGAEGADA